MGQLITVAVSHQFDAPADRVFTAWTEPEQVRKWLSLALKSMGLSGEVARVEIDTSIGGTFFFSDIRNGAEFCHWGTYLEVDYQLEPAGLWDGDIHSFLFKSAPDSLSYVTTLKIRIGSSNTIEAHVFTESERGEKLLDMAITLNRATRITAGVSTDDKPESRSTDSGVPRFPSPF